jgi:predicted TIM-barrel fold metal-dependent hydrolase
MKTIALEEHFVTADFLKATGAFGQSVPEPMRALRDKLLDLGEARIAAMDEGDITLQILSLAAMGVDTLAPADQTSVLRGVHDELASAVAAHPDRFAAFATPGLKDPAAAVKELERCINTLGFKGFYVDGTTDGKFLDAPEFFPVLEAAEALRVPLYLHPAPPPAIVQKAYYADLPGETGMLLSIAGWGWHAENGLHPPTPNAYSASSSARRRRIQVPARHNRHHLPHLRQLLRMKQRGRQRHRARRLRHQSS